MTQVTAVPSLLFHDIADEPSAGGSRWTLSRADFLDKLRAISASGRTPLSISRYADGLAGRSLMPQHPVVLSFDDGYASWRWVAEQLSAAKLESATMYITTGWVDTPGYLSSADLAALPSWVDVAAHGVTHRRLDELATAQLRGEVRDSVDRIEQLVARPCLSFAYPHGNYDRRCKTALVEAGLRSGAAVRNAFSHLDDDVLALSRLTVTADTPTEAFQDYLRARGAPVGWTSERLRSRAFRYARRGAATVGRLRSRDRPR